EQNNSIKVSFINSTESGRFSQQHLRKFCADFNFNSCFICGPNAMIDSCRSVLLKQGFAKENIKYERFSAKALNVSIEQKQALVNFKQSHITVSSQESASHPQTLLEMAEDNGLKPITGCRMGVCHQCICQKQSGVVYNTLTKAFSDTGAQEVQLCVSVPVGEVNLNL
ncbi:MAG TPA: 2Fe-2S iron-sulfur cluster binding domain-containing protein, partial [Oceanospirillales bacterium]|nr:2Fe-2S iron-sulfur cluster binding domain-containing protein [Oceanospirillales bacterium]